MIDTIANDAAGQKPKQTSVRVDAYGTYAQLLLPAYQEKPPQENCESQEASASVRSSDEEEVHLSSSGTSPIPGCSVLKIEGKNLDCCRVVNSL